MIRKLFAALFVLWAAPIYAPGIVAAFASLDTAGFTTGAVAGFVFGLGVVVVGYRWIHNSIVESDRNNDLAGVNKKHDARRI